jgi:hypothetical protein
MQAGVEEKTPVEKILGPQSTVTSRRWIRGLKTMVAGLVGALTSVRARLCPRITDSMLCPIAPTDITLY